MHIKLKILRGLDIIWWQYIRQLDIFVQPPDHCVQPPDYSCHFVQPPDILAVPWHCNLYAYRSHLHINLRHFKAKHEPFWVKVPRERPHHRLTAPSTGHYCNERIKVEPFWVHFFFSVTYEFLERWSRKMIQKDDLVPIPLWYLTRKSSFWASPERYRKISFWE